MKIIAVTNRKGGSGKSTTSCALTAGLTQQGKRVLCVDCDPQSNATMQLVGVPQGPTLYDVLTSNRSPAARAIIDTLQGALLPSDSRLATAGLLTGRGDETRLKRALEPLNHRFDYAIIDTPPNLGPIVINALSAADFALIPVNPDRFSADALRQTAATVATIQRTTNPALRILGAVVTMYNKRWTVHALQVEQITTQAAALGIKVYSPPIRSSPRVQEAQFMGRSIYDLQHNPAAEDYSALTSQILADG